MLLLRWTETEVQGPKSPKVTRTTTLHLTLFLKVLTSEGHLCYETRSNA